MKKFFTILFTHCIYMMLCGYWEGSPGLFINTVEASSSGDLYGRPDMLEEKQEVVAGTVVAFLDKTPLAGVNIIIKGTLNGTTTDTQGQFTLEASPDDTLTFSFIGYETREVPLKGRTSLYITLIEDIGVLSELQVVSTGYQQLPKERATGSFVQLDNEIINRSVSTGVLDRLEHVASGLVFKRSGALYPEKDISIRGRSTLFANEAPLIIVDNFPYDGDINNINPNDVQSITVLKDAAAASIWGARAGNGVIVITTKQGAYNREPQVSFNSNVTIGERPDPFYVSQMSVDNYIDTEMALFESGFYTRYESARDKRALNPVTELLIAQRGGELSSEETAAAIATLRGQDVRQDFEDYLYRESINQQYAVSIRGGSERQRYFLSAGYDHNRQVLVGDQFRRITLNAKNTWAFFDHKLQFTGDIYYAQSRTQNNGLNPSGIRISNFNSLPPYIRLADEAGNPLPIYQDYRPGFLDVAEANGLLSWRYSPLEEMEMIDRSSSLTDYRVNTELRYQLLPSLDVVVRYQYWHSLLAGRNHYPLESYYARDLINRYTQVNEDGSLSRPVPEGGILDREERASHSHNGRAQLNYNKNWNDRHEINAMAGYEMKELVTTGDNYRFYGYDDEVANSVPVDYITRYSQYYYPTRSYTIPNEDRHVALTDRFVSLYANASYTYADRYMLSVSGRKDQSNLFGVNANQRGVPLWSAGLSWNIHEEAFYHIEWLPYLKLRATYGYNGNIDKSVTAFTTAQILGNSYNTGLLYAAITNPPNPDLQWERVEMKNFGLDFSTKNNRLQGSIEYYTKKGKDLIGYIPISPAAGQALFRGNVASTEGYGVDVAITSRNIDRALKWDTHWLYSHATTEVTNYKDEPAAYQLLQLGDRSIYPVEGRALYGLYSYPWAGLNPETGNPQGYLDGEVSEDYGEIIDRATVDSLIYHGPAHPTTFGAFRNTLSWKNLSLSVNISYRLGHYFRRRSIIYDQTRGLGGHGDYALRWQEPGDEAFTQVPSLPEDPSNQRDDFYTYSQVLIEKGDNIRLQDINLTYTLNKKDWPALPFRQMQIYGYVRNLGIIWKASGKVPDPEYRVNKVLRSYSLGLRVDF